MDSRYRHSPSVDATQCTLLKHDAKEELHALGEWLLREANQESDTAVAHLKALHHVSKKTWSEV